MDKLAFITGASSGIGQALASRYHRAGWRLALVARRTAEIDKWAQAQRLPADRYAIYGADVADIDSIVEAGAACIARQGVPDVVIANAGISVGIDTAERSDLDVLAQYAPCPGNPRMDATLPMPTSRPLPRCTIARTNG